MSAFFIKEDRSLESRSVLFCKFRSERTGLEKKKYVFSVKYILRKYTKQAVAYLHIQGS